MSLVGVIVLLSALLSSALAQSPTTTAVTTTSLSWIVTRGKPTNVPTVYKDKDFIMVNGKWPIPEVRIKKGDVLQLEVNNQNVVEGVTLHAHGFRQQNNNQYDGPEGVTEW